MGRERGKNGQWKGRERKRLEREGAERDTLGEPKKGALRLK